MIKVYENVLFTVTNTILTNMQLMFCAALTYALYISSGGQARRETREAGGSAGAGVR